jgi:hypothetical protein
MPKPLHELESDARALAAAIAEAIPGTGFALFLFDFGAGGNTTYISNAKREDMIENVKEWLERQETGRIRPPQRTVD